MSECIYSYQFDTELNRATKLSLEQLQTQSSYWVHLDYAQASNTDWLNQISGLNPITINALTNPETRPRVSNVDNGLVISLRGVNLHPGNNPEDMVSIRIWLERDRLISSGHRPLLSLGDLVTELDKGRGPGSPVEFFIEFVERLTFRMANTIEELEDKVAQIEEDILANSTFSLRTDIANLRRQIIGLRRYLSPQREAMQHLHSDRLNFFNADEKLQLRETADTLIRHIEELDSIKDRATVCSEELNNQLAEQMNQRMYVLSIISAVFLPLGFLTGLFGINVGGMPGADNASAFWLFIVFLLVTVALQLWILKTKKWF